MIQVMPHQFIWWWIAPITAAFSPAGERCLPVQFFPAPAAWIDDVSSSIGYLLLLPKETSMSTDGSFSTVQSIRADSSIVPAALPLSLFCFWLTSTVARPQQYASCDLRFRLSVSRRLKKRPFGSKCHSAQQSKMDFPSPTPQSHEDSSSPYLQATVQP